MPASQKNVVVAAGQPAELSILRYWEFGGGQDSVITGHLLPTYHRAFLHSQAPGTPGLASVTPLEGLGQWCTGSDVSALTQLLHSSDAPHSRELRYDCFVGEEGLGCGASRSQQFPFQRKVSMFLTAQDCNCQRKQKMSQLTKLA